MEKNRLKKLEETISLIPDSLEEIFDYTIKEIPDTESEFIKVFANFESNEFEMHILLYDIFNDYYRYCKNSIEEALNGELPNQLIDINSIMHFYLTYFDHSKDDLSGLMTDFIKMHNQRGLDFYQFIDFIFSILSLLNNIQTYKTNVDMIAEINNIKTIRERKMTQETFRILYKKEDNDVYLVFMNHFEYLYYKVFRRVTIEKFKNYFEISHSNFLDILKTDICEKYKEMNKQIDNLMKDVDTKDSVNFYDFLERILRVSFNYDKIRKKQEDEIPLDEAGKLDYFVQKMREIPEIPKEKDKKEKVEKGEKADKKDK